MKIKIFTCLLMFSFALNSQIITISSGGNYTIEKTSSTTVVGNFTNNGTVTLNSDADEFASIIVQGSSSGDIVYNRYVNTVGSARVGFNWCTN